MGNGEGCTNEAEEEARGTFLQGEVLRLYLQIIDVKSMMVLKQRRDMVSLTQRLSGE